MSEAPVTHISAGDDGVGEQQVVRRLRIAERSLVVQLTCLFLAVTAISAIVAGGHSYAIDNEVQFQTTRSLVQLKPELESVDGYWVQAPNGPYRERADGGHVAIVAIGQSLVAAPFYVVSRTVAQVLPESDRDSFVRVGTFFTNSVVLGLIAVVLALIGLEINPSRWAAFAVAVAYALGTYALPHAQTFFTELTSALVLAAGTFAALRFRRTADVRLAALCGLAAGFGVLVRPSSALFVPIFGVWLAVVAWRGTSSSSGMQAAVRSIVAFVAGGVLPLIAFLGFNAWRFGDPFDIGYQSVPQSFPLLEGLANQFFRPGKSLLLFAPIIILGLAGIVVGMRRQTATMVLIVALVATNLVFFSRVPFWAGDAAWGSRYQHIVLPLMCAPAVVFASMKWFRAAVMGLASVGALVPAFLGSVIYFNVLFIESDQAGVGGAAITDTAEWQPFLGHLELLPVGIRDVLDANHPDERDRGVYDPDPTTHYGYFGWEPRVDFWWLWVGPTDGSAATYLFAVPILLAVGGAVALWRTQRPVPSTSVAERDDDAQ